MTRTGEALQKIGGHVQSINSNVKAMVTSSQEQSVGIQEINTAVNQMDQVTQQNAAMVEETTAAVHTVFGETETLNQAISRFQISGQASGPRRALKAAPAPPELQSSGRQHQITHTFRRCVIFRFGTSRTLQARPALCRAEPHHDRFDVIL